MRFPPHKAHAIARGRITTLCVPVKPGKAGAPFAPCPFKADHEYAVPEPLNDTQRAAIKRGDKTPPPPLGHVRVVGVPRVSAHPKAKTVAVVPKGPLIVTPELAKTSGDPSPTVDKFKRDFVREWDRAWINKHERDFNWARYTGHGTVSWILLERFRQRWEGRQVWFITLEPVAEVRYLAQPDPVKAQGDYTPTVSRAIDPLATVDPAFQEKLSKDALGFCIGRQQKRAREQADAKAERGRSMRLAPHERMNRRAA